MSIVDFIAVMSFGLTCFGLGYTFGKDNNKPQKQPPWSGKLSGIFVKLYIELTVYRQHSFFYIHISMYLWKCQIFLILYLPYIEFNILFYIYL